MKIKLKGVNMLSIVTFLIVLVAFQYFMPVDSTDKSRWKRSGMSHYVDNGTGCHYLSIQSGWFGKGTLVPRLNKDGTHYCEKE